MPEVFIAGSIESLARQRMIKMYSLEQETYGKHVLFTMAQRAVFDFDEGLITVEWKLPGSIINISYAGTSVCLTNGLLLSADNKNNLCLIAHKNVPVHKLLDSFLRCASRMIRLDIP